MNVSQSLLISESKTKEVTHYGGTGLCSSSARWAQTTKYCLQATRKTYFLRKAYGLGISWLEAFGLPVIFLRAQSCPYCLMYI